MLQSTSVSEVGSGIDTGRGRRGSRGRGRLGRGRSASRDSGSRGGRGRSRGRSRSRGEQLVPSDQRRVDDRRKEWKEKTKVCQT